MPFDISRREGRTTSGDATKAPPWSHKTRPEWATLYELIAFEIPSLRKVRDRLGHPTVAECRDPSLAAGGERECVANFLTNGTNVKGGGQECPPYTIGQGCNGHQASRYFSYL